MKGSYVGQAPAQGLMIKVFSWFVVADTFSMKITQGKFVKIEAKTFELKEKKDPNVNILQIIERRCHLS